LEFLKDCITLDELDDEDVKVEEEEEQKQEKECDDEGTANQPEFSCPTARITAGALLTRRRCGPHVDSLCRSRAAARCCMLLLLLLTLLLWLFASQMSRRKATQR